MIDYKHCIYCDKCGMRLDVCKCNVKPTIQAMTKVEHRAAHSGDDIFAGHGEFEEEENHNKCFNCGEYTDDCMCDGGLP